MRQALRETRTKLGWLLYAEAMRYLVFLATSCGADSCRTYRQLQTNPETPPETRNILSATGRDDRPPTDRPPPHGDRPAGHAGLVVIGRCFDRYHSVHVS